MATLHARFAIILAVITSAGCQPGDPTGVPAATLTGLSRAMGETANVITIDHQVPHVSSVSANSGELVHLFVRERVRNDLDDGKPREAVLTIHGRSVPVLAVYADVECRGELAVSAPPDGAAAAERVRLRGRRSLRAAGDAGDQ